MPSRQSQNIFFYKFAPSLWGASIKRAEIIPFEPETGNAGAGKRSADISIFYSDAVVEGN